jgi:protocatechuate 3,4-dioxygenase beta subunit
VYFVGDQLIRTCPIVNAIADAEAVERLTAVLDLNASLGLDTLAYGVDLALRGQRSASKTSR